jgi:hypothetical protein
MVLFLLFKFKMFEVICEDFYEHVMGGDADAFVWQVMTIGSWDDMSYRIVMNS